MSTYSMSDSQRLLLRQMAMACTRGADQTFTHVPYRDHPGPLSFSGSAKELEATKADLLHLHSLGLIKLTRRHPLHVEGIVTDAGHAEVSRDDSEIVDLSLDSSVVSGSSLQGMAAGAGSMNMRR